MKKFLNYALELDGIQENKLPESDMEEIKSFNDTLVEKYNLQCVEVLKNDNLLFCGKIKSITKKENDAKLILLERELKEYYKKYGLKKIIRSALMYGDCL